MFRNLNKFGRCWYDDRTYDFSLLESVVCGCRRFKPSLEGDEHTCANCNHFSNFHEDLPKSRTIFTRSQLDLMESVAQDLCFKSDPARKEEIVRRLSDSDIKYKSFIGWMTRKRVANAGRGLNRADAANNPEVGLGTAGRGLNIASHVGAARGPNRANAAEEQGAGLGRANPTGGQNTASHVNAARGMGIANLTNAATKPSTGLGIRNPDINTGRGMCIVSCANAARRLSGANAGKEPGMGLGIADHVNAARGPGMLNQANDATGEGIANPYNVRAGVVVVPPIVPNQISVKIEDDDTVWIKIEK